MPDSLLQLKNVSLRYEVPSYSPYLKDFLIHGWKRKPRVNQALNPMDFAVAPGERWGVVGLNGSGKSSLCGLLAGHIRPSSGEIRRHLGNLRILSGQFFYSGELTGWENLQFLLETFPPEGSLSDATAKAAEFSGLGSHLGTPIKFYSKGMRARLFLSCALLDSPDFLILDEALSGADWEFQDRFFAHLESTLVQCRGVVLVSHQLEMIRKYCNQILVLDHGAVAYQGPVEDGLRLFKQIKKKSPRLIHQGFRKAEPMTVPHTDGGDELPTPP